MTLLAGTGITLAGTTTIAAGSGRFYLVTLTNITPGGETASLRGLITGTM